VNLFVCAGFAQALEASQTPSETDREYILAGSVVTFALVKKLNQNEHLTK
jgi:hypothetical protein